MRRARRRALLVAGALAGVVLGLEVSLRAAARLSGRTRGMTHDAVLGWRPLPGVVKSHGAWSGDEPGFTSSRGWRDGEHELALRPGARRIVALGDSFVFGSRVDYGARFTELLEDDSTEVINMGVSAWGTDQEVLAFELEGRSWRPDVVVLVVCVANDLDDLRCERKAGWPKPWFELADGALVPHAPHIDWTVRLRCASYTAELALRLVERGEARARVAPAWENADPLPLFAALVRRLAADVEACGAELLVVVEHGATPAPAPPSPDAVRVLDALRAQGIATLDLLPAFAEHAERWAELRLPCLHWSRAGHRVVADLVRADLGRRGWL